MAGARRQVYQPLHPSIRSVLDPEYVEFHDEVLQYVEPSETQPWDPASRLQVSPFISCLQGTAKIGRIYDKDLGAIQIRVFEPNGDLPKDGWPCLVWIHGGGYVNGGLGSDNGFLSHVCKHVNLVVISINYRHAPEYTYPAAHEDSFAGLKWIMARENAALLSINPSRVAIGGLSAGGNITAIVSMKAAMDANLIHKPVFQLLICPVIDNSASVSTRWATSLHSPWLTPSRMGWYQSLYFPKDSDKKEWNASPCFAPEEVLVTSPKTFIAVAECDLLAPEALAYANSLKHANVEVEAKVYKGATHCVLLLAGTHRISQQLVHDACSALARQFGASYDAEIYPVLSKDE